MNKTIAPITEVTSVEELQIMVTWLCGSLETMMLKICDRAGAGPEQREEVSAKSWEATAHIYALNAVASRKRDAPHE